jgi:hypothetical protein
MISRNLQILLVTALLPLGTATVAHVNTVPANTPDFGLSTFPGNSLTMPANGDRYLEDVYVSSIYGFSGNVLLSATSNSSALNAQLGLAVAKLVSGSYVEVNITFSSIVVGAYSVNVTGTSGSLVHSVAFQILVMTASVGDFAITASQQSLSMLPGSTTSINISISSLNDFSGPVYVNAYVYANDFYTLNDPFALQASLNKNQVSMLKNQTSVNTLTLETPNLPIHAIYTVKIDTIGGLPTLYHSLNITVSVLTVDFTLKTSPDTLSTAPRAEANSTIIVRSYGFIGTVDFAVSVSPSGVNCTFSKTSTPLGGGSGPFGNSTLSCRGMPGTYTITITATSGSLNHSTMVSMKVEGPSSTPPETTNFTLFGFSTITATGIIGGTIALLVLVSFCIYSWRKGKIPST